MTTPQRTLSILILASAGLLADVRLPSVLSDHMMLQRDTPVRIWGKADAGEPVSVQFAGQSAATIADSAGRWQVWLKPMPASSIGSLMVVQAKNTVAINDVLVGEVWIASGQSNMVWEVRQATNGEQEVLNANNPQIRIFEVAMKTADAPRDDVEGSWAPVSADSVRSFSAVGYFFARHLQQKLGVPVAVIQSAWGGTPVQAWTRLGLMESDPSLRFALDDRTEAVAKHREAMKNHQAAVRAWEKAAAKAKAAGKEPPEPPKEPAAPPPHHAPATLWNAMMSPLTPYAIRGAIWYQGENNAGTPRAAHYQRQFTSMIRSWREAWGQGDFPFLWVQLANYGKAANAEGWSLVQEAQLRSLELRRTGQAVAIDVGNPADIHPTDKQSVGERLALAARHIAYGEQLAYSGPVLRQATTEGGAMRLWLNPMGRGLKARDGVLKGFVIAGADRVFHKAEARIEGSTIVVSAEAVPAPAAVRYAWAADPEVSLYNVDGLPASPFRTDIWTDAKLPAH